MADETNSEAVATTEAPATRLSDDPKIVDAVQKHLDAFADLEENPGAAPVEEVAAEETPTEEKPVEETPTEEKPVEEKPVEAVAAPLVAAPSTLPAAYVRTAKARNWTDQEIADFAKANPDLALKTFERMHASRTQEISEWAELGRKTRQGVPNGAAPVAAPVVHAPASPAPSILAPINVQELVEKFGNEELIKALAGPINTAIASVQPLLQQATSTQAEARRTQMESLGKTVRDFFTADEMTPYADVYGKDESKLTTPQIELRSKVLETADALIAGAAFQGRTLSVPEALTLAHDSVSSDIKEKIITGKIRTSVVKREKQITLKPTAQGRTQQGGPPRSRGELLARTEDRLASAFG